MVNITSQLKGQRFAPAGIDADASDPALSNVTSHFSEQIKYPLALRQTFAEKLTASGLYNNEDAVIRNFDQLCTEVRGWLRQASFKQAEAAFDFMLECKKGKLRKDGRTPSALHEVTQAIWLISCLEDNLHVTDPEGVMSLIFVHDLGEDYGILPDQLETALIKHGTHAGSKMETLKKDFDVISKRWGKNGPPRYENEYAYSKKQATRPNTSVAKKLDRPHNIMTIIGVQDIPKISVYIAKTMQLLGDDIEECIKRFPEQEEIYKTLGHLIERETQVCRYYIVDTGKQITDDEDLRRNMPEHGFKNLPNGLHPLILPAERIRQNYLKKAQKPTVLFDNDTGDFLELSS